MKVLVKLLIIITLLSMLFGCASTGPKFTEINSSFPNLTSDSGRIYLYRTTSLGAALKPNVVINGEEVGKSVAKGFFYVDKPAGNYEIVTSTEVKRKLSLTLDNGQTRYVKFNVSMGFLVGHVYPVLVDNKEGESDIQNCRYTGEE